MSTPLSIMSWNVNSIRARLDHVLTYLYDHEPDVVCLQETKVQDNLFPRVPFLELGYTVQLHGGKALAGVATLTKAKPDAVQAGFAEGESDRHPRILMVRLGDLRIYNLYVPNGTELGSDAYRYKIAWLHRLRAELDATGTPDQPLVIVGDFNVAPDERDVYDGKHFEGRLLFTDEEHEALGNLVGFGLHDCFRKHVADGGHYSWFDYRTNGFQRNEGLRIDHVYATTPMAERCTEVVHDPKPRGWEVPSDHLPVVAKFS
ncbi:MAG: exodeoxyribonuclease III [Deltaproteobacteria bacterium]|nr:exodeoxyribonuclease III [Deltaproteobacteria bacterium]